jgi:hypothetical protein
MHAVEALALWWLQPDAFARQPLLLTGLMAAAYGALLLLARSWGAMRCTWTAAGAAAAAAARPAAAKGALARGCRCARLGAGGAACRRCSRVAAAMAAAGRR